MPMPQGEAWTAIKAKIAPENVNVVREHRDMFWYYVSERYQIYLKRRADMPRPWTEDPILDAYHFTNVFRKHDRGTRWLMDNWQKPTGKGRKLNLKKNISLLPWIVIQYRMPNYNTLFLEQGWIPLDFTKRELHRRIKQTEKKHGKWFTSAHIVLQSNFNQSRAHNYVDYLDGIRNSYDDLLSGLTLAGSMKECFKHLMKFKGLGGFTSYEVMIDLCNIGFKPLGYLDQWAHPGPGCKQGIDLIYPNRKRVTYEEAMYRLRDNQHNAFRRLDLPEPPDLTVQDIEFSLCEFSKYMKIHHETGRKRRYTPSG